MHTNRPIAYYDAYYGRLFRHLRHPRRPPLRGEGRTSEVASGLGIVT